MTPLHLGTSGQFDSLRSFLLSSGYTEQAICERVGAASIYDFKTLRDGRGQSTDITDRLDALIRILMDGEAVDRASLESFIGVGAVQTLEDLDVVRPLGDGTGRLASTVFLYPQLGIYIAADRTFLPDGESADLPVDVVYASVTRNTGRFLSYLPTEPCERLLDLCAGTGIAALAGGAVYASRAWASDLGERCVHFIEFNRRLNGIDKVEAVHSDLFQSLEGMTFDRIVAHPPYVPSQEQKFLFRDGGEDGELLVRGIVQGLPRFLEPGGRAYLLTSASDRENETLQQRVRTWLGDAQNDFDVYIILHEEEPRPDAILRTLAGAKGKLGEAGPNAKLFDQFKITKLLYGVILVERHGEARPAMTARCRKAPESGSDAIEWFRKWHRLTVSSGFSETVLASRPRASDRFRLSVIHAFRDGALTPVDFKLRMDYPLRNEARAEAWVAMLIGLCDGSRTTRQIYADLLANEVVTAETQEKEVATVIAELIGNGFLEIAECPLPVRRV